MSSLGHRMISHAACSLSFTFRPKNLLPYQVVGLASQPREVRRQGVLARRPAMERCQVPRHLGAWSRVDVPAV